MIKVIIERAEGYAHECVRREFSGFRDADLCMMRWARTAPRELGYHKCDVEVHFTEHPELAFGWRFDLQRQHAGYVDLAREADQHCAFYAGARCPAHMDQDRYLRFLAEHVPAERHALYVRILGQLRALVSMKLASGA